MTDTRQHLDAALPEPRRAGGVVGYVAELQQFDPDMTAPQMVAPRLPAEQPTEVAADPAVARVDEPAGEPGTADDDTADLTLGWADLAAAPGADAVPLPDLTEPAPPARGGARRRLRAAVLSCAALAVLAAAGVGYAALNQNTARSREALPPGARTPALPGDPNAGFTTGAIPGSDAPGRTTPTGTVTPSVGANTPGQPATVPGGPAGVGGIDRGGDGAGRSGPDSSGPGGVGSAGDGGGASGGEGGTLPDRPSTPGWPSSPDNPTPSPEQPPVDEQPTQSPQPPVPPTAQPDAVPLTATLSRSDALPLGLGGYSATVRVVNPGTDDVTGWRVTLTVPDGTRIRNADGAAMSQHRDTVEFVPSGNATVAAGGSVTFTFEVRGVLAADPGSCTINGSPCG